MHVHNTNNRAIIIYRHFIVTVNKNFDSTSRGYEMTSEFNMTIKVPVIDLLSYF